jgi:hydroxyacylglutathione hydrolase
LFIRQYVLECLSHASYLVVDEASGVAVVVDPQRDVTEYVADATAAGTTIQHVVLTHFHGDFVTSHLAFRDQFNATVHVGSRGEAAYDFSPVHHGDSLEFDGVELRFIETPGHTPESICVVVYDKAAAPGVPFAVLTGETLMIGDIGKPDLVACGESDAVALAEELFGSLNGELGKLPDETIVYPSHSQGSICGPHTSRDSESTLGIQRTFNHGLQPMSKEAFVEMVTADQPPVPSYWGWDAQLARRDRPFGGREVSVARVMVDDFAALAKAGAQIVDGRDSVDFAGAHFEGSVNVGLDGALAEQARGGLDLSRPAYVVVYPGGEAEIAGRLAGVGMTDVAGFLSSAMGYMEPWLELVTRSQRVAVLNLVDQRLRENAPTMLDIREPDEWSAGHINGAMNIPLGSLVERLGEIPNDRALVVYCEAGFRAPVATSILQRAGVRSFAELIGGMQAWLAYGLPTVPE